MSTAVRNIIWVICSVAIIASAAMTIATGGHPFTQFPSDTIAEMQQADDPGDLFSNTGLTDTHEQPEEVENEFHFGWLPAGGGASALSFASISGPALVIALLAWFLNRRGRGAEITS